MVRLEVNLYATLRDFVPNYPARHPLVMIVRDGTTISDLLDILKIPPDLTKLIYVNGRYEKVDYVLKDGDQVGIFPPIAGG